MTKKNSNLHRAAALLAALCLLASMALPVYAAETETDFSVSNSETIPDDDNTGNGADGTGSDISVSNLETIQKDADTTNEGSKTEPEISVPESGTIPSGADTTDKAAGAPLTEGVTGSENTAPADNAAADKTADADKTGEDSTGSEDEAGFLNEGDSADDRMITAGNENLHGCQPQGLQPACHRRLRHAAVQRYRCAAGAGWCERAVQPEKEEQACVSRTTLRPKAK